MATPDAPEPDVFSRLCASRLALEEVGTKWAVLTLVALGGQEYRFNELRRRVDGVSERMLARTLRSLEHNGLVHREVATSIPPHVRYSATRLGVRVAEPLRALTRTLEAVAPEMVEARRRGRTTQ